MQPPESWVSNIQESGLTPIAAYYLWRGLAPSTRCNYDTPRSRFTTFCTLRGYCYQNGGCLPAKATWLIEWLCSLAGSIKVKTMKHYLAGIRSYQLDLGIDCGAFSDPRLERTLQGIKRDHNEPERRVRTPLTRPHLVRMLNSLQTYDYDDIVTRAAFTLAFAGFLRIGEFTYRAIDLQMGSVFHNWFLTKSSIQLTHNEKHIELTLPASKTDPFRQGIQLIIAGSNDEACPVRAMKRLLAVDTHRQPRSPLFCVGRREQLPFTRQHVVQKLQELGISSGLGPASWNGHSFRRGAATWAAEVGISETQIQTLGRWRSDAYKAYIEYSPEERISLSERFQGIQLRSNG